MTGWAIFIIWLIGAIIGLGYAGYKDDDEYIVIALLWPAVGIVMAIFGIGYIPIVIGKVIRKLKHEKRLVCKPDGKFNEEDLK